MSSHNVSCPSGFPEFTPSQERIKQQWVQTITHVFESYGFFPVTTPMVEREENFLAKGGNPKEMYVLKRLLDDETDTSHSGNALRFDHTVPLALYIARHLNDIRFPFRRYCIGPVFRGERAQKGRFRQFDQCDIDIVGSESLAIEHDGVLPSIMIDVFSKLNIGEFVVRISNRKLLRGVLQHCGVNETNLKQCIDIIDDMEKKGIGFVKESLRVLGLSDAQQAQLLDIMAFEPSPDNNYADFFEFFQSFSLSEEGQEGLHQLRIVFDTLACMQGDAQYYRPDISIARGLDYYTGTIYETTLTRFPHLGSICSGGRYDDLTSLFTGKSYPGVGMSIGLTRLLHQLFDEGVVVDTFLSPCDILIVQHDQEGMGTSFALQKMLRCSGFRVETYLEQKKMKKQFEYADYLGVEWVCVIGEDEIKTQSVCVKNMKTGTQETVRQSDIVSFFEKNI